MNIFNNYFDYGNKKPLSNTYFNNVELYRLFINLLFQYYNNFLYRLIRYRYILDYKNYIVDLNTQITDEIDFEFTACVRLERSDEVRGEIYARSAPPHSRY